MRFEHDHHLNMWALTDTKIEADFLCLDEAQDTNPVLEQSIRRSAHPRPAGHGR